MQGSGIDFVPAAISPSEQAGGTPALRESSGGEALVDGLGRIGEEVVVGLEEALLAGSGAVGLQAAAAKPFGGLAEFAAGGGTGEGGEFLPGGFLVGDGGDEGVDREVGGAVLADEGDVSGEAGGGEIPMRRPVAMAESLEDGDEGSAIPGVERAGDLAESGDDGGQCAKAAVGVIGRADASEPPSSGG